MTTKLNDNPADPLFQVQVNLWGSTFKDAYATDRAIASDPDQRVNFAMGEADKAVKGFAKRFKAEPRKRKTSAMSYDVGKDQPGTH